VESRRRIMSAPVRTHHRALKGTSYVNFRRRIIGTHARTVKRGLKENQKIITDVEIRLHRLRHRKKR
jgi:hypothetical protein